MDSMKRFDQQLKKGVLEMILLKQISREPGYGYDLRVRIKENSCGRLTIEDGTLYPLLYRLEDEGCITAEWETTETSQKGKRRTPPKKVYQITQNGLQRLQEDEKCWRSFSLCINNLL